MTDIRNLPLRDVSTPGHVSFLKECGYEEEDLDAPLSEHLSPLIGGTAPAGRVPKWAWTVTVRTVFENEPRGEYLGCFLNFWDAIELVVTQFSTFGMHRHDYGSWDEDLYEEFKDEMTRDEFDNLITAVRLEVYWDGVPAMVVLDSVRIGRFARF